MRKKDLEADGALLEPELGDQENKVVDLQRKVNAEAPKPTSMKAISAST